MTERKQREHSPSKCKEYLTAVKRLFELQRKYALAYYDGTRTDSIQSAVQAEYERLESVATSLGVDFQVAFGAAQSVWHQKGSGTSVAEAKGKTQVAIEAARAAFLKEGGVCDS